MKIFQILLIGLALAAPALAQLRAVPNVLLLEGTEGSFDVTGAPPGFNVSQVQVTFRQVNQPFQVRVVEILALTNTSFRVRVEATAFGGFFAGRYSVLAILRVPGVAAPLTVAIQFDKQAAEAFRLTSGGAEQARLSWSPGTQPAPIPIKVDFIPISPGQETKYPVELVVATTDNVNWLQLTPSRGETSFTATATIDPIEASRLPADQPSLAIVGIRDRTGSFVVEMNLQRANPSLTLSRTLLQIPYLLGAPPPPPETVRVSGAGSFTTFQMSGMDWLRVSPVSGTAPADLQLSLRQPLTERRTYEALILVSPAGGAQAQALTVTVTPQQPAINVPTQTISFSYRVGGQAPEARALSITGSSGAMLSARASSTGNWLSITPASASVPATLSVRAAPGVLPRGIYEGSIEVESPGTPITRVPVRLEVTGEDVQTSAVMTQIAAGAEWKTTLILVNTSGSASTFVLRLRDDAGNDWPVSMLRLGPQSGDLGNMSTLSDTIPAGGTFTYQTREQPSSPVRSGYAELTSGTGIRGQAIFQQANPGGFDYEAAIPMSFGTRQFFAPFDNAAATTSIALVNQGTASSVTAYVRNERGELLDTRILTLAPGQHRAEELERLVGSSVVSGSRRGTVEFRSEGAPIAALGLRFRGPFTSFPVIAAGGTATSAGNPVMAQIAAGSEWKTTLLLVNTTAAAQTFTLLFWRSDGSSWPLPLQRVGPVTADLGTVAILSETIPAYGMYTYQTSAQGAVSSGFAELTSGAGVRGQAVFQQILPGGMSYEAAAPMETSARNFLIPYDNVNTAGRPATTSVALVNPGPTSATTQMTIRDDRGTVIGTGPLTLIAGEQTADTLEAVTFGLVRNKRGTVEFSFSGADVSALGLRFRGPFTSFSAIPK